MPKRSQGGEGGSPKDHRGSLSQGKKIDQTEGAHKGNYISQDQLSRGGSRSDIFIDQY